MVKLTEPPVLPSCEDLPLTLNVTLLGVFDLTSIEATITPLACLSFRICTLRTSGDVIEVSGKQLRHFSQCYDSVDTRLRSPSLRRLRICQCRKKLARPFWETEI